MSTQQQTSQPTSQPPSFYHPCLLCNGFDPACPIAPRQCEICKKPLDPHCQKNRVTCSDRCRKRRQVGRPTGKH